jgi:hypothetical protein
VIIVHFFLSLWMLDLDLIVLYIIICGDETILSISFHNKLSLILLHEGHGLKQPCVSLKRLTSLLWWFIDITSFTSYTNIWQKLISNEIWQYIDNLQKWQSRISKQKRKLIITSEIYTERPLGLSIYEWIQSYSMLIPFWN